MNRELKSQIILYFGNQADAAQSLQLQESRLSRIIRGRVHASKKEREAFARVFGPKKTEDLLGAR